MFHTQQWFCFKIQRLQYSISFSDTESDSESEKGFSAGLYSYISLRSCEDFSLWRAPRLIVSVESPNCSKFVWWYATHRHSDKINKEKIYFVTCTKIMVLWSPVLRTPWAMIRLRQRKAEQTNGQQKPDIPRLASPEGKVSKNEGPTRASVQIIRKL